MFEFPKHPFIVKLHRSIPKPIRCPRSLIWDLPMSNSDLTTYQMDKYISQSMFDFSGYIITTTFRDKYGKNILTHTTSV